MSASMEQEANRLHNVLEDAGIKLASVASDVLGVSGRQMLDALLSGTRDPEVLAELARGRLRAKLPALRQALVGKLQAPSRADHHAHPGASGLPGRDDRDADR